LALKNYIKIVAKGWIATNYNKSLHNTKYIVIKKPWAAMSVDIWYQLLPNLI